MTSSSTDRENRQIKGLNFFNLNWSITGVSVKFLLQEKDKASFADQLLVLFFRANSHACFQWKDICDIPDILGRKSRHPLLHFLSIATSVLISHA